MGENQHHHVGADVFLVFCVRNRPGTMMCAWPAQMSDVFVISRE